jgi:predicted DNA-binding protein
MKRQRTEANARADLKHYLEKRKGRPRTPAIYLTDEQEAALDKLAQNYGSKTAAILAAINNEIERIEE